MLRTIKSSSFFLGFLSIIAQIIVLRELVVVFYGNELIYGFILSAWLFWIACGSSIGHRLLSFIKDPHDSSSFLQMFVVLFLPFFIVMTRYLKSHLGIEIAGAIGILPMLFWIFVLLAPIALFLGAIYTILCYMTDQQRIDQKIGVVYLWEAMGAAVGGVLLSLILMYFLSSFLIVFLLGVIHSFYFFHCLRSKKYKIISLMLGVIFLVLMGLSSRIDLSTRAKQWKGYDLIAIEDSVYGHLDLVEKDKEYSLYENGALSFTTNDRLDAEFVHFALLSHWDPQNVLLIGNGLTGALEECLKYEKVHIDHVELDEKVLRIAQEHLPVDVSDVLTHPRVRVIIDDARRYIKTTQKHYDVILVNMPSARTAFSNRYYTKDFFKEARLRLSKKGILSLRVPSSENYLSEEDRGPLRSVFSTLKSVFLHVVSFPGNNAVFLASFDQNGLTKDPETLSARLIDRGILTQYVHPSYLPFLLSPSRLEYMENVLHSPGTINTDVKPVVYFYNLVVWSKHFDARMKTLLSRAQSMNVGWVVVFISIVFFLFIFFSRKRRSAIRGSIITTGFCEIVFQVIVMIAFQTLGLKRKGKYEG